MMIILSFSSSFKICVLMDFKQSKFLTPITFFLLVRMGFDLVYVFQKNFIFTFLRRVDRVGALVFFLLISIKIIVRTNGNKSLMILV